MTPNNQKQSVFLQTVKQTIQRYEMLSYGDSVLVGLSGGADSVALLLALLSLREEYGLQLSCAHVNHGLRAENARRDMAFCVSLCQKWEIPLVVLEEDVKACAKQNGCCVEEAGRMVRYRFFQEQKTDKIAVAHTKDDTAETVFMNLVKGNLPIGVPPMRDNIIRPLIGVRKEEIISYLKDLEQPYVTDETNFSKEYMRNRVRLDAIPYLTENFNKNFTNVVYNTADILFEEQNFLDEVVADFLKQHSVAEQNIQKVSKTAIAAAHIAVSRKAVRKCYYACSKDSGHISFEQINRLIALCKNGQSGKKIELPGMILGEISGDWLIFSKKREAVDFSYPLTFEQWTNVEECGYTVCLSEEQKPCDYCYPIRVSEKDIVLVRNKRDGDKIYFANQDIHKKVSDFLSEKKIPPALRGFLPMISVNGEIRVIAGYFREQGTDSNAYILMNKT
ncbi:MAG: tRNA lysidine(34) synthetase TilS [Clostridia bacterium]|nr:tRNA lysidine(34) synthetase TilS [Clostridia bacterium]